MIYYKIEMHHNEKTFESLSRMQYDLFCASNRITRTILSILFIAGGIINLSEWWGILLAAYGCYLLEEASHLGAGEGEQAQLVVKGGHIDHIADGHLALGERGADAAHVVYGKVGMLAEAG